MTNISDAVDAICEAINCRDTNQYGTDAGLFGVIHLEDELCELFTKNGEVLTCEGRFGDLSCFCWGKTKSCHKAWVDSH